MSRKIDFGASVMKSRSVLFKIFSFRFGITLAALSFSVLFGEACSRLETIDFSSLSRSAEPDGTTSDDSGQGSAIHVPIRPVLDCNQEGTRGSSNPGIRRLNQAELMNAVHAVTPFYSQELESALTTYSDLIDMTDVNNFQQVYSLDQMQQWSLIVDTIATTIMNSARANVGGSCFTADPITDACWTNFFTNYGKQVYRHPLAESDVTYLKGIIAGLSTQDAVYTAVTTLLRSPDFLFHLETGTPSADVNRVRLTDYEVANRIAFAITGKPPDATLLATADSAQLQTKAQVEVQVRRLLNTSEAQIKLAQFFSNWLQFDRFAAPDYAVTSLATSIGWGSTELNNDALNYLTDVFWGHPGSFNDLMTRTTVFPTSDSMKIAYNTPGYDPSGKTSYASLDHPGLATRIAFLSQQGAVSHPISRGVFVLRRLLCQSIPTPDFSIVASRDAELGNLSGFDYSNAELVTKRTSATACIGCHSQINPIGFALEAYDVFGKARTTETFIDWSAPYAEPKVPYYGDVTYENPSLTTGRSGQMFRGALHPLPYPVSGVNLGASQNLTLNSPADLTNALGTNKNAMSCLSTFVLREFERRAETVGDSCAIQEATQALKNGVPVIDVFVRMIATEDIFWRGL